ncbi:MAG TPA: EAL domain-containing protein [Thermoleophilaceae bacterium]|nr:EAL domain-containing protein [Thermoleophilaceae bacterium]
MQQTRPALSEAERIASLSPVLLASADDDLRLIHLNGAWERALGWQPEDLAGSRIVDLVHAEDRHVLVRAPAGNGNAELSFECRMGTRAGRWCWMSMVLRREGERWYCAARDTTERHERMAEAQRVAGIGSFDMDAATGAMWWSDHLYAIYGLDPKDFEPTLEAVTALIHPEDRARVGAAHARVLDGLEEEHEIDVRIRRPDGQMRELHARSRPVQDETGAIVRVVGTAQDVTDRRLAERRLAEREAQLRALVEQVPAIVYTAGLGADAPWDYVSPQIETLLGYTPEEWSGRRELWWEALHPDDRAAALEDEQGSARPGGRLRSEYRLRRRAGGWVWVRDEATVIENERGELRFHGVLLDITERKRAEAEARAKHAQLQAIIDNSPLLIWAKDRDYRYLFANLEHDALGPTDGASIVGRRDADFLSPGLAESFVESDREVLETGRSVQVEQRVEVQGRARSYLVQKFPLRDEDGVYGVCGIAIDMTERQEREDALRSKVEWSFRIRNAIENDRLVLHRQPIVELASGRVVQEELLVRMLGDDDELIMPGEFLPPAERFGLAPAIDRWVIARAAEIARERRVEVNLSAHSIGDPSLPDFVEARLSEAGAAASNLVFEITETAAAEDLDQARRLAERLVELGCGFALDDFGTGYGSFTYLKHLPVRYIKIDTEFVRTLRADSPDRQVVSAIVDVARNFGIETIAEGVEAEETAELLRALGVHYAQGYHFGRPAPVG